MLQEIYAEARDLNPKETTPDIIDSFEIRVLSIDTQWQKMGVKFGDKLEGASPNLFTFLRYHGMAPTNNESERALLRHTSQDTHVLGLIQVYEGSREHPDLHDDVEKARTQHRYCPYLGQVKRSHQEQSGVAHFSLLRVT